MIILSRLTLSFCLAFTLSVKPLQHAAAKDLPDGWANDGNRSKISVPAHDQGGDSFGYDGSFEPEGGNEVLSHKGGDHNHLNMLRRSTEKQEEDATVKSLIESSLESSPRMLSSQCYTRTYTFESGISGDWDQQTTQARQNTIDGVWAMHSRGNGADGWSRMRYAKYTFNNHPSATTRIKVTARGAPDGGKNSNAYLIETRGKYDDLNAAIQDGTKDELDFFEYYGGSKNKATMNVFRRGKTVANYPKTFTTVKKGGNQLYTYELILKKQDKYMLVMVYDSTGKELERYELTGDSVPSQPMELFIGIWDCSGNSWCPGKVGFDTWMAVQSVFIEAC